jgi:hypothetical protein
LKPFLVAALQSALDLGIAIPDDVIRHVTADVLAAHLPRPLWARLLTACLGAARVDATLIVDTIGVPNLCEHVPPHILWACIEEVGLRSLSRPSSAAPMAGSRPIPLSTPPPPPVEQKLAVPPATVGPTIPVPAAGGEAELDASMRGARIPPGQRFRSSTTGIGRLAATSSQRRPQAQATSPTPPTPPTDPQADRGNAPRVKRGQTEHDFDLETYVGGKDDWKNTLAVEDEQLVDWAASDETVTNGDEIGRKR